MKKFYILSIIFITMFSTSESNEISKKEIDILKNLRCLVCQGQSVADSNSDFAQTIKLVVNDQVNLGKSNKEIYNFLKSKYGEWIVYQPSMNKGNFLLWALPYMVLFFGGIIILIIVKKEHNK